MEDDDIGRFLGVPYFDLAAGIIVGLMLATIAIMGAIFPSNPLSGMCISAMLIVGGLTVTLYRFMRDTKGSRSPDDDYSAGTALFIGLAVAIALVITALILKAVLG